MKFLLTRTSHEMDWDEDDVKCPLDEKELLALRVNLSHEKFDVIDRRSVADPADVPAHHGEDTCWWYQSGENHSGVDAELECTARQARYLYAIGDNRASYVAGLKGDHKLGDS